jgi:hypothetical protein
LKTIKKLKAAVSVLMGDNRDVFRQARVEFMHESMIALTSEDEERKWFEQ